MFKYIQHRNILKGQDSTFIHYTYIQGSVHLSLFCSRWHRDFTYNSYDKNVLGPSHRVTLLMKTMNQQQISMLTIQGYVTHYIDL